MASASVGRAEAPRKIRIITTTRAEWHLLAPLTQRLVHRQAEGEAIEVGVIVGAAHLLARFGDTVEDVRRQAQCPVTEVDFVDRVGSLSVDHSGNDAHARTSR